MIEFPTNFNDEYLLLLGLLTYSLRTLSLIGVLSPVRQRRWLIACQLYVRAPLCSFAFALSWTSWVGGRLSSQALFTALLVLVRVIIFSLSCSMLLNTSLNKSYL